MSTGQPGYILYIQSNTTHDQQQQQQQDEAKWVNDLQSFQEGFTNMGYKKY